MNKSSGVLHIRREVRSLGPEDRTLKYYADAVARMRKRPQDDPTSWLYQAAIHGTYTEPALPTWNKCTHGSWFFLPWHRMFVHFFEEIVRAAIVELHGDEAGKEWALPYWNYCRGGEYASLPKQFREPTTNNPLYTDKRDPRINGGSRLREEVAESKKALARPHFLGTAEFGGGEAPPNEQFWSQGGALENTPHNVVHGAVGGPKGWMSDIDKAAKDPIFWLHHTNIDRIWVQWIAKGGKNPTDPKWLDQKFEFFDTHGQPVSKACHEVLDTTALGYKYDAVNGEPAPGGAPSPPAPAPEKEIAVSAPADPPPSGPKFVGATEKKVTLTGDAATVPVEIDEKARAEVRAASTKADPRHLYLNIENIEGDTNPGTVYGIYVNLPEGADEKVQAEHHVGNVSFFGIEKATAPRGDEHGHSLRVSVEVGGLLRALGGGEHFEGEQIHVTFCPLSPLAPEGKEEEYAQATAEIGEHAPIHVGRVSLAIDS